MRESLRMLLDPMGNHRWQSLRIAVFSPVYALEARELPHASFEDRWFLGTGTSRYKLYGPGNTSINIRTFLQQMTGKLERAVLIHDTFSTLIELKYRTPDSNSKVDSFLRR